MTATATGNPPRGQAAPPGRAPVRRRRRIGLPRASTTPGKLRLIQAALIVLCLAWGALAALTVSQHASAADNVAGSSEPISLDAQQMYQSLADADVTVSTGYLYGRIEPFADRERYQRDIAVATADLKAVTAASGTSSIGRNLSALSAALPIYTGYVEDGEIYNSLGFPAGGSFIQVASEEMHLTLLPAARSVYTQENAQLTKASAQATGLPLDNVFNYGAETKLEIGSGPGTAGTLFGQLETNLGAAINTDQGVFAANAASGADAFTGLEAGIIVLALVMAAGCAWGLSRRLAEYR
jgi:hypothetical protein